MTYSAHCLEKILRLCIEQLPALDSKDVAAKTDRENVNDVVVPAEGTLSVTTVPVGSLPHNTVLQTFPFKLTIM
jgi:hypothetical protein